MYFFHVYEHIYMYHNSIFNVKMCINMNYLSLSDYKLLFVISASGGHKEKCTQTNIFTCVCAYICEGEYLCIYIYIYIYREREREREFVRFLCMLIQMCTFWIH